MCVCPMATKNVSAPSLPSKSHPEVVNTQHLAFFAPAPPELDPVSFNSFIHQWWTGKKPFKKGNPFEGHVIIVTRNRGGMR